MIERGLKKRETRMPEIPVPQTGEGILVVGVSAGGLPFGNAGEPVYRNTPLAPQQQRLPRRERPPRREEKPAAAAAAAPAEPQWVWLLDEDKLQDRIVDTPPPAEEPFETATMSAMARSFYAGNARVSNARLEAELGVSLRYPNYRLGLEALSASETAGP